MVLFNITQICFYKRPIIQQAEAIQTRTPILYLHISSFALCKLTEEQTKERRQRTVWGGENLRMLHRMVFALGRTNQNSLIIFIIIIVFRT